VLTAKDTPTLVLDAAAAVIDPIGAFARGISGTFILSKTFISSRIRRTKKQMQTRNVPNTAPQ